MFYVYCQTDRGAWVFHSRHATLRTAQITLYCLQAEGQVAEVDHDTFTGDPEG